MYHHSTRSPGPGPAIPAPPPAGVLCCAVRRCDQLAGTFKPTHPKVKQMTPAERREYNWRPLTMLLKLLGSSSSHLA